MIPRSRRDYYEIEISLTADCSQTSSCHFGVISGSTGGTKTGDVSLHKQMYGQFNEALCAANCSDSTLVWSHRGYTYSVGMEAGRQADLVILANDVIDNSF